MSRLRLEYDTRAFDYPELEIPPLYNVRFRVEAPVLTAIEERVLEAMRRLEADPRLSRGASVAVGVGSRGIANLQRIVRQVVARLQELGTRPFIVPAMGSHGGATAEGQAAILAGYGITEEAVGAPVRATMEVVQAGTLEDGYPVYFDQFAAKADAVMVVNRIKHHTDFHGRIESGLAKMCAIGLGKQKGAAAIHRFGAEGLRNIMPRVAQRLLSTMPIVGGLAVIENPYGETAEIHGLTSDEIGGEREMELLDHARRLAPRLAFEQVDVLVVDLMGKDISGSGLDTHVIGRVRMPSIREAEWPGPEVRLLCVLDVTEASHGNAAGLGLADITTRRLVERMDMEATLMNHRTSGEGGALRGKLPLILETPEAAVRAAMGMCGKGRASEIRLVRIRDTEHVELLQVSEPLLKEARAREDLEILGAPQVPDFNVPLPVLR
jgi:hypothetical protein